MNTAKDEVRSLLDRMPDNCTLEDIQHHLYVLEKIRCGLQRAESEGTVSQEEAEERLSVFLFSHRKELTRRLKEYPENPGDLLSLEELQARIERRK